jgi:uridylate kinase
MAEDITVLLKHLGLKLPENDGHRGHRQGRKPRVSQEVQMIKKVEDNNVRLQVLVGSGRISLRVHQNTEANLCTSRACAIRHSKMLSALNGMMISFITHQWIPRA